MSRDAWNDDDIGGPDEWEAHADPEGPQPDDLAAGEDGYDVVPCPHCGREISELTERCPHCGDWITPGAGSSKHGYVWLAIAILLVVLVLLWVF